jgi:hypothetical protein
VANRITKQFSSNYPKMMDKLIKDTLESIWYFLMYALFNVVIRDFVFNYP